MVEVGEAGVEAAADFFALEGARSGIDGEFGQGGGDIECAFGAFEVGGALEEVVDFVCDEGNVGAKGFGGQAKFDKLC